MTRLVATAGAIALAACGTRAEEQRVPAYDDIQRIFDAGCLGCHAPGGRSPDLAPAVSYRNLVDRPSTTAPGRTLVVPGAPDDSYLLCTIDPTCDHQEGLPAAHLAPLSPSTIEAVRRWIDGGARPDDTPPPADAADGPPTFAGLDTAIAGGEHALDLQWTAAFDRTPPSRIRYRVYLGTAPGGEDFATPRLTVTGATTATVDGLAAGTRYHLVVHAVDEDDHEDGNRVERTADTLDVTAPEFAGATALTEPVPGTLDVAWAAAADNVTPAGSLRYRVFLATSAGGEDLTTPTITVTGVTHATLPGLAPSTTYHVVVRAVDQDGNQDGNLIERSLTTADTVPPIFAGVATATGVPGAVQLTWAAATDDATPAAGLVYLVYRALIPGSEDFTTPTYVTPAGATSFAAGGLAANRTYAFVVRARDAAGNVDGNLVERSATTPIVVDNQPPMFAGAATATATGASTVRLTWPAATDNVTLAGNIVYRVYRATAAGAESFAAPTYTTLPGATSFVAGGLTPLTSYFFVVRAGDNAGNQDGNSVEVNATTTADVTPPAFAGITGAAGVNAGTISLAWNPASDDITAAAALVYDVYRATFAGGESFAAPTYTTQPGATGFLATGLSPLTTYFFVVRARDAAGNRDPNTVERAATTGPDVTPPVFTGAVSATPTATAGQLDVTWAAASDQGSPANRIRYLVHLAQLSHDEDLANPTAITAEGATSFRFTGLLGATTYFVVVRARDEAGNVDTNFVEVSATTTADTAAPTFAGLVTATALNPVRARLTWAAGSDDLTPTALLVYDVYAGNQPGGESFAAPTATSPPGATTMELGGLTPTSSYAFVVRARDQGGNRDANVVERSIVTGAVTVSFAAQVQPIFTASCLGGGCHDGPFGSDGLALDAANAYSNIVNVHASDDPVRMRVAPGQPDASYLYLKLLGAGGIMPPTGALPAVSIQTIRTWIDDGAPDN